MDQNTQLKIEFFELCRRLNTSNLHKNQKTEISFFIVPEKDRLILYASTNQKYKIQLILKKSDKLWIESGFSSLNHLESELAARFNKFNLEKLKKLDLIILIKSFVFQELYKL